jgi:hypothetical protein
MRFNVKKFDVFSKRASDEFVEFFDDLGHKLGAIWLSDDGQALKIVSLFHPTPTDFAVWTAARIVVCRCRRVDSHTQGGRSA